MSVKRCLYFCIPLVSALACGPLLAQERAGSIFYSDGGYSITSELTSSVKKLPAVSSGTIKLGKMSAAVVYTDGQKMILENPEKAAPKELDSTTDYSVIGEVFVLEGGKSFLYADAPLSSGTVRFLEENVPFSFSLAGGPADLVRGRTPGGKGFTAISLRGKEPDKVWSPTIAMRYAVEDDGKNLTLTEFCLPMGMKGFSKKVKDLVAVKKDENVLIGAGMGGSLAELVKLPVGNTLRYLSNIGMEMAAPDNSDIGAFWEWESSGNPVIPAGAPVLVCSNLEIKDPKLAGLIKPYYLREIAGVRTAFISLIPDGPLYEAQLAGAPLSVRDPFRDGDLRSLLDRLRSVEKAKLVVAVSHLDADSIWKLISTPGVDIVIGPKLWENTTRRKERVELSDWDREIHELPAMVVSRGADGLGRIELEFAGNGSLKAVTSEPVSRDREDSIYYMDHASIKERIVKYFMGSGDAALPDMRRIYPDKDQYSTLDFYDLAAAILREHERSEIAFLKIRPLPSTVPGDIPSSMVRSWLDPDEPVVRAWVPGALIRSLKGSLEIDGKEADGSQKYFSRTYYAEAGLAKNNKIAGLPLRDTEMYLAAFPESFLRDQAKNQYLKNIRRLEQGRGTIKTIVMERLFKEKGNPLPGAWEDAVRKLVGRTIPQQPQWRLNLRNLALHLSNTSVNNNSNFSGVSDSKANASDQTVVQGSGRLYSELYKDRLRVDTGVSADYYRTTVWPAAGAKVVTENMDQLLFESEFRYSIWDYKGLLGAAVLGPFVNAAYDTEFSRNPGLPRRKVVRTKAGMKLFEGAILQELYTAAIMERTYTYSPARDKYALEAGFRLSMLIPGTSLTFSADGSYRNFSRTRFDTVSDLKQRLEINTKFSTRFYGDVMISPFLNYYAATGTVFKGTATNLMTGVSFEFSRLFKLKH